MNTKKLIHDLLFFCPAISICSFGIVVVSALSMDRTNPNLSNIAWFAIIGLFIIIGIVGCVTGIVALKRKLAEKSNCILSIVFSSLGILILISGLSFIFWAARF